MTSTAMHFAEVLDEASLAGVLRGWRAEHPGMGALVLLPEAEPDGIARVQSAFRAEGVPVVGAVFPALLAGGRFATQGAWLLRFDEMPYGALHCDLPRDTQGLPAVAEAVAKGLGPYLGDPGSLTLLLLFDAMFLSVASLLDELYLRLANRVHYMGANAGSESFKPISCLFDSERAVQGGMLSVLLPGHRGGVLEHGYGVPARMITATSTAGNRIMQIDWRPAFEVYREMGRFEYGVEIDRDNFYNYAVHFPFGIVRANGVILVRIPVSLEEDGSLFCVGEVPANSVLTLLRAPPVDSVRTLDALVAGLGNLDGPLSGTDLLLFYCAGRRLHLGVDSAAREIRDLERRSGAGRLAGALSLGEIGTGPQWAYPLFHNGALLASRWGAA